MDALTERTVRRLGERLETLRQRGPIPALMAESRVGASKEETLPLYGFGDALWSSALRGMPDGSHLSRCLWLRADAAVVAEFRSFCRSAGELLVPMLRSAGHPVGFGTSDLASRWLWSVFELAELRLPGTDLRLVGKTVMRMGLGGVAISEGFLTSPGPLEPLAKTAGDTRYWQLEDAVEASLAVLDIAQTGRGPAPIDKQVATPTDRRRSGRSTRKIDVDHALGKLEAKMQKELSRDLGSESATESALVEQLYSLSAENLVAMLRERTRFKVSAKTIRRPGNSQKYEAWGRYRSPRAPSVTDVDVGPAALSDVRPRAADVADDAVDSGNLSRRAGGRGTTRIGKTASEKAAEDAADRFAQEAGVELPPAE
jgi:hypothetical protein